MKGFAALLSALLLATPAAFAQATALSPRQLGEDFDAMWRALDADYAYFDRGRRAWQAARGTWRAKAARARSRDEFLAVLEGALEELGDDHVSLAEASRNAPRRVAAETDIAARWRDGAAVVEAVRPFSDADVAGVRPGQAITKIQGMDIARAVDERLKGRAASAAARDRALMQLLAGPRRGAFRVEVRGGERPLEIERLGIPGGNAQPLLARRVGEGRDLGYIRVRDNAGEAARGLEQFDAALNDLMDTRALLVDLRESPGPGSRAATHAILGRFAEMPVVWQQRAARGGPRVADAAAPRPPRYRGPLLVLVDRWTVGEAEALAAGLQAAAQARLIGTPTAGLRGELREAQLPHSGIHLRFPAERSFWPDGTEREALRPDIAVDLVAPSGGPGDPILYQALKVLEKR